MHDGDRKALHIADRVLTIKPQGNNQTWVVRAPFDTASCTAMVNFDVPGKPGPPPVALQASYYVATDGVGRDLPMVVFYDPSGTLAPPQTPLNTWVAMRSAERRRHSESG